MKVVARVLVAAIMSTVVILPAAAKEPVPEEVERKPDAALAAAVGNVVFLPIRLAVSEFGGILGGFTGFMTAGNRKAADDVWDLFKGQNILTPEIVEGKEPLRLGYLEFTATGLPK